MIAFPRPLPDYSAKFTVIDGDEEGISDELADVVAAILWEAVERQEAEGREIKHERTEEGWELQFVGLGL